MFIKRMGCKTGATNNATVLRRYTRLNPGICVEVPEGTRFVKEYTFYQIPDGTFSVIECRDRNGCRFQTHITVYSLKDAFGNDESHLFSEFTATVVVRILPFFEQDFPQIFIYDPHPYDHACGISGVNAGCVPDAWNFSRHTSSSVKDGKIVKGQAVSYSTFTVNSLYYIKLYDKGPPKNNKDSLASLSMIEALSDTPPVLDIFPPVKCFTSVGTPVNPINAVERETDKGLFVGITASVGLMVIVSIIMVVIIITRRL